MAFVDLDDSIVSVKTPVAEFSMDDLRSCDVIAIDSSKIQIILNHKVYIVYVENVLADFRKYRLKLGHDLVEVELVRRIDQLVQQMGLSQTLQTWIEELKAPMPGLVKKVLVAEKEEVILGQNLLLLEAMKMENVIKSPQSGVIKQIAVSEHQTVDKGQLLLKFET